MMRHTLDVFADRRVRRPPVGELRRDDPLLLPAGRWPMSRAARPGRPHARALTVPRGRLGRPGRASKHRPWAPALAGRRVAYHHSCHALRELGVRDEPLALLAACGRRGAPWVADEECCGFGGLFSAKLPEVSAGMADRKLDTLPPGVDVVTSDGRRLPAPALRARGAKADGSALLAPREPPLAGGRRMSGPAPGDTAPRPLASSGRAGGAPRSRATDHSNTNRRRAYGAIDAERWRDWARDVKTTC
jgi:hypothetical protein